MTQSCSIKGCEADKAWAIIKNDKLYRLTFSRSLAEYIANKYGYEAKMVKLFLGPVTEHSKLFAICKPSGWPLRVTLFKEAAELWESNNTIVKGCEIELC